MLVANFPVTFGSAGSLSASINSSPMNINRVYVYSFQVIITGTPVGSLKMQVSNDFNSNGNPSTPPTNWTDVTTSVTAISGAGSYIFEDPNNAYAWVRFVYTASSSTGAIAAMAKTVGV